MISKPGLMRSVCEENDRLEIISKSKDADRQDWLELRDGRRGRRQTCNCKFKHRTYKKTFRNRPRFGITLTSKWNIVFKAESMSHQRTCPLFASSASTAMTKFRVGYCGALLAGAIEASISITRGAGGYSISPVLRGARVVSRDNPAFELVITVSQKIWKINKIDLEALLDTSIHELVCLFHYGEASPYDVDLEGNTLLHVRMKKFAASRH